jgi:hypothetical protein
MLAAATIIVVTATILARVVSNSGMSNTNVTLVVFSAVVATVAAARPFARSPGRRPDARDARRGRQRIVSMPLASARARSLREGPLGCTSPRSHLLTSIFGTFNAKAKVAWLI